MCAGCVAINSRKDGLGAGVMETCSGRTWRAPRTRKPSEILVRRCMSGRQPRDRDTPYRKLIDLSLPRGSECGSSRKASVNNASFNWINVKCGRRSCHPSKQARCGDPKGNKIRVGRKVGRDSGCHVPSETRSLVSLPSVEKERPRHRLQMCHHLACGRSWRGHCKRCAF